LPIGICQYYRWISEADASFCIQWSFLVLCGEKDRFDDGWEGRVGHQKKKGRVGQLKYMKLAGIR
jgi:hypothetical protein